MRVCMCVCAWFRQRAAPRGNIDFERSERERVDFETAAARVMNHELQAPQSEVETSKELVVWGEFDGSIALLVRLAPLVVFKMH